MSPISQSQFIPLGEILCLAISAMNSSRKPVTQEALMEHLTTCFPGKEKEWSSFQMDAGCGYGLLVWTVGVGCECGLLDTGCGYWGVGVGYGCRLWMWAVGVDCRCGL